MSEQPSNEPWWRPLPGLWEETAAHVFHSDLFCNGRSGWGVAIVVEHAETERQFAVNLSDPDRPTIAPLNDRKLFAFAVDDRDAIVAAIDHACRRAREMAAEYGQSLARRTEALG